jgi:hypothetical protein
LGVYVGRYARRKKTVPHYSTLPYRNLMGFIGQLNKKNLPEDELELSFEVLDPSREVCESVESLTKQNPF